MNLQLAAVAWLAASLFSLSTASAADAIGASGRIGCTATPHQVERLEITKSGVYENYLVDSNWAGGNRVKITADDVVVRNCEIRNASGNGIGVFAANVTIENCRIHHLLKASFADQQDAHGITGRPRKLVVRNCDISYVSGDCLQFDPDRNAWDDVLVENCTLWTGPLPADAAGFNAGERPGENAFDSKTPPTGSRCRITFRNCLFHGWNQPAQIDNAAALNFKENVEAVVENCLFRDNEICFRVRGPGSRGGALVQIKNCAALESAVGVRMEDNIENLRIESLGFGSGVVRKYHQAGDGSWPGYENRGEWNVTTSFDELKRTGVKP